MGVWQRPSDSGEGGGELGAAALKWHASADPLLLPPLIHCCCH